MSATSQGAGASRPLPSPTAEEALLNALRAAYPWLRTAILKSDDLTDRLVGAEARWHLEAARNLIEGVGRAVAGQHL
jgi:hypothetical protein